LLRRASAVLILLSCAYLPLKKAFYANLTKKIARVTSLFAENI